MEQFIPILGHFIILIVCYTIRESYFDEELNKRMPVTNSFFPKTPKDNYDSVFEGFQLANISPFMLLWVY